MRRTVSAGLLCIGALLMWPPSVEAEPRIWVVRPGEALGILAERFGVTVAELRRWNGLSGDLIQAGQELIVDPGETGDRPAPPATEEDERGPTHVVQEGQTLSGIAELLGVSMEELLAWNEGLDADRIYAGQQIRIERELPRTMYRVRSGDRLARIAKRHGVSVRDILRWNRRIDAQRLAVGSQLLIHAEALPPPTESVGSPDDGRLIAGAQLQRHPGYVIRDPSRSYGTDETLRALRAAFDAVLRAHPDAPRLRVHDISHREGGRMSDHVSHQSGRDVDISFYQRRCEGDGCPFLRLGPSQIDRGPEWTLVSHWLRHNDVEAIFIDYELQQPLYEEARRRGATRAQLHRWFQYPRGPDFPIGVLRHYPHHRNHMHVRFRCPRGDGECR